MKMASPFSAPWPDPNSPVLSKIDFGVPLVELFKWLDIRDTLLGQNERNQDVAAALALARDCKHPEAVWLTSIFDGKDVSTSSEAKKVLDLSHQTDALALCFAWLLMDEGDQQSDLTLLHRSFEMGNAFACSTWSGKVWGVSDEEAFRFAQLAAAQFERNGFYCLGCFFRDGIGCEQNLNLAKQNLLIAAELGHVWAADRYGFLLDEFYPTRWLWWGRAAFRGCPRPFLRFFSDLVERFFSGSGNASAIFLIGRAFKGSINMETKEIFGDSWRFEAWFGPANQAVGFHESQIKSARLAVDTWTLISSRLNLIKDMRIFIGKMIWEARFEANYKI